MKKLKLVIADNDREYVQSLERYILVNYPHCFELHSFTKPVFLSEYMDLSGEKADIMLLGKEYYQDIITAKKHVVSVLLSDEITNPGKKDMKYIYRYQHAEKLITGLIAVYSENSGKEFLLHGQGDSSVFAVFSGAGGCGKTSVAVCSSIMCARQGIKVLYINLESVCSTSVYFNGDSSQTFSNVIYYLKENSSNLASKIEGARCTDPDTGVHFFRPPENVWDMEELLYEDAELLINILKRAAIYDVIFIDLSCGFSSRNLAVLKACDSIMSIETSGAEAAKKEELVHSDYEALNERYGIDVEGKNIVISNMNKNLRCDRASDVIGFYPEMERKFSSTHADCPGFVDDVGRLMDSIFRDTEKFKIHF